MWVNEWEAMVLCIFLGVVIPFFYSLRQPLDTISSSQKNSKYLVWFNYIVRPINPFANDGNFAHVGWAGPSISMFLCVFTSIYYHFDDTTKTHCDVSNPLPSISAAVGNNLPERWFFRYGILLMSHQRLLDGSIHFQWLQRHLLPLKQYQILNHMMYWFHWFENICLFTIAFVSSTEYYPLHEKAFILWAVFQQFKMMIQIYLGGKLINHPGGPMWERRSWVVRVSLWIFNTVCLIIAGVVFYVHMTSCIPYLYAFYALLEYIIVGSNILFNCCILMDWPDLYIVVSTTKPQDAFQSDFLDKPNNNNDKENAD